MVIINKGTSFGWEKDELEANDSVLGLSLISVLNSIVNPLKSTTKGLEPKYYGLVEEAKIALIHDIHGLSVLADMLKFTLERNEDLQHKNFLYVMELTEKYFTNIRSIYDFISKVLRLAVKKNVVGQISFDSMNGILKYASTNSRAKEYLPKDMINLLIEIKSEFLLVREIRDLIIHSGKEITILHDKDGYKFGPFNNSNRIAVDEHGVGAKYEELIPYLAERTNKMLIFGEDVAYIINREFRINYYEYPLYRYALEGVCIFSFNSFLGLITLDKTN